MSPSDRYRPRDCLRLPTGWKNTADEFEVDRTTITPEAPLLETLDLDSLDLVDVVVIVDKNFGVTLTGPDFKELKTFRDFYDLIISRTNGK